MSSRFPNHLSGSLGLISNISDKHLAIVGIIALSMYCLVVSSCAFSFIAVSIDPISTGIIYHVI